MIERIKTPQMEEAAKLKEREKTAFRLEELKDKIIQELQIEEADISSQTLADGVDFVELRVDAINGLIKEHIRELAASEDMPDVDITNYLQEIFALASVSDNPNGGVRLRHIEVPDKAHERIEEIVGWYKGLVAHQQGA